MAEFDVCPHPPSEYEHDPSAGTTICGRCGMVIESNQLRTDHVFENAPARRNSRYQPRHRDLNYHVNSGVSRQQTLDSARMELNTLSYRLTTSQSVVSAAVRIYGLILDRKLHTSLRKDVSLAVCLYIACRIENTTHLLYEFGVCVGEDLSSMNAIYIRFCSGLGLDIPPMDPSVYLTRLAMKLQLNEEDKIVDSAQEILRAMRKEWIDYGRRPYGVVAAALLLACQMNGESRSVGELSRMVNLSEDTILLRLTEFCRTDTAQGHVEEKEDRSAPPRTLTQNTVHGLSRRLMVHESRLAKLRGDLMRMLSTSQRRACPTPLAKAVWESYWTLRNESAALFLELVATAKPREITTTIFTDEEYRRIGIEYQVPYYTRLPNQPNIEEDSSFALLRDDVEKRSMDRNAPVMSEDAVKEAVVKVREELEKTNTATQQSTTQSQRTVADEAPELCETLSVSDGDGALDEYVVRDTEEVARRRLTFNSLYHAYFERQQTGAAEEPGTQVQRKRGRSQIENVPFEASSPAEAALIALSRGVSSGINPVALKSLLDGAEEDDGIPLWGDDDFGPVS
eukprot:PhF_6_TR14901/c0_g1_i1/m.23256/K15196/BRF1, GTF3B; transcription factor IIIB 90 kDa subunit